MHKPFWRINIDHARYGLTGLRIQSLACFTAAITLGFLLRLSTIAWGVSARCVEADQFWFEPYKSAWPLGGVFFLAFFLLLVWNASIFLNQIVRRKFDVLLSVLNFVLIVALFSIANPALNEAALEYNARTNKFGDWAVSESTVPYWLENQCDLAAPYVGRWKVIERDLPEYGLTFPALWIDMKQTLKTEAADSTSPNTYEGGWNPPSFGSHLRDEFKGIGEFYWDRESSTWLFELNGNSLTLTTPESLEWQAPARVVLQREDRM